MAQYPRKAREAFNILENCDMTDLYIGLMSGTSADGVDAALVDFSQARPTIVATHYAPYQPALRASILALCQPGDNEIQRLGELDILLGKAFAQAVNTLLKNQSIAAHTIKAVGSHGQTIRHHPLHFTLQIGDPNTIAAETGITTIADFRRKDIAFGGQGAPLVPAFHQHVFGSANENRVIVNIGGIANVTHLRPHADETVIGFDTGPGNMLLDAWIHLHQQESYDKHGAWGASGQVQMELLENMLADPYFQLPPPKSTGREYFNLTWLEQQLQSVSKTITAVDTQATLVELTARTIMLGIHPYIAAGEILVCGGGAHNQLLMSHLTRLAQPNFTVATTQQYGITPDWVEAVAFAWLARQTLNQLPGNLPSVTGAKRSGILGGVFFAD